MRPVFSKLQPRDEKLGLILRQLDSLRARVNSLAIQRGLFESLSLIAGAGALLLLAAFLSGPLAFLCIVAMLGAVSALGLFGVVRRAWRMRATAEQAAALADRRAGLKGRLTTLLTLGSRASGARLWPYLLEDTLSLRDEFQPRKVEPRTVSRSIYGLLACCLLAAMVARFALTNRRVQLAQRAPQGELEADLNDLDVRPADSDLDADVDITGDPAAMRKLADKLAAAEAAGREPMSALGGLMGQARGLAGDIQDKLTGHKSNRPRLRLHIADSSPRDRGDEESPPPRSRPGRTGDNGVARFQREHVGSGNERMPLVDSSPGPASGPASEGFDVRNPEEPRLGGEPLQHGSSPQARPPGEADELGAGGSSHGSGSDPNHLFGQADEPPLGSEGFEIMIEARPAERGAPGASQSYLPPKVRAALNPRQHPDDAVLRSTIPDDDRVAIERVFDR